MSGRTSGSMASLSRREMRMSRLASAAMILTLAGVMMGCHSVPEQDGRLIGEKGRPVVLGGLAVPGEEWLRTELYFGLKKREGEVSDSEWEEFVANEITPRFPAGLTIVGAYGQWKNASGLIENEPSRMMILLHAPEPRVGEKIEELRAVYCRKFEQESVLRVTSRAVVSFGAQSER